MWRVCAALTRCVSLLVLTGLLSFTDTSSGSEDEGSVQGDSQGTPTSSQGSINMEHWISQAIHGSTTSTTSSSSTQSGGSGAAHRLADVMAQTHIGECLLPLAGGAPFRSCALGIYQLARLCVSAVGSVRGTAQSPAPTLLPCCFGFTVL